MARTLTAMRSRVWFTAATVVLLACIDFTPPPELPTSDPLRRPGSIVVTPSSRKFTRSGSEQFTAVILDHLGEPVPIVAVTWTSSDPEVVRVTSSGLATPRSYGTAKVIATFERLTASADVVVDYYPTPFVPDEGMLCGVSGNGQAATVMQPLPIPIVVHVCDSTRAAVSGARVAFTTVGGQVTDTVVTTDVLGHARTSWILGPRAGDQSLRVTGPNFVTVLQARALPLPADTVVKLTADVSGILSGDAVSPPSSVTVEDRYGNPISNVRVDFAVTRGGGQITGAAQYTAAGVARLGSWIVDTTAVQEVTASVALEGIRGNPVTFRANVERRGAPSRITATSEINQSGPAGYAVMSAPAVIVTDDQNHLLRDVPVLFTVTSGGGSVSSRGVITGADGAARLTSWTIMEGVNTLTASVEGLATPVTFTATGVPPSFNIAMRYLGNVDATVRAAFDLAAARWSRVIYGDLPDVPVQSPAGICGRDQIPAVDEIIDDIVIYVIGEPIDGGGNAQFTGSPCYVRDGSLLPAIGVIRVDDADAFWLGSYWGQAAALHSVAHVLGFGTLWQPKGLLSGAGTSNPRFLGSQALAAWHAAGGAAGISTVPVSATYSYDEKREGVALSRDVHWHAWFVPELMTPFTAATSRALSAVTAGQFADLGYLVNMRLVDPFQCAPNTCVIPPIPSGMQSLVDDVTADPIVLIDRAGRVVRTLSALPK